MSRNGSRRGAAPDKQGLDGSSLGTPAPIPGELIGLAERLDATKRELQATYYDWDDMVLGADALDRALRHLRWHRVSVPDLANGGAAFDYATLETIERAIEDATSGLWLREWIDEEHPAAELHERKDLCFWFEREPDLAAAATVLKRYQTEVE